MTESLNIISNKVLVLGLDGATFDLILPWIEDGILPQMANVLKNGVWGELVSTIPPLTPPAWASFITGKNPGKHGIFDFRGPVDNNLQRTLISSLSIKSQKLWNILNEYRKKVGIINIPITYPPEKVDGFMISGMLTPNTQVNFTYPPELKEKLFSKIGDYVIDIDTGLYDYENLREIERFFNDLKYATEKRRDALFYLMKEEPWDFLAVNFIVHDRIQHLFWKYLDKKSSLYHLDIAKHIRDRAIELYQMVDNLIGLIIEKIDKETSLFIISDHGFGPQDYTISINGMLANLGLLYTKRKNTILRSWIKALLPLKIRRRLKKIVSKRVPISKREEGLDVDYKKSKAYFGGSSVQGIYLRVKNDEYFTIREIIKTELSKLKDPLTGKKLVETVLFKEEAYYGDYLSSAPDILFIAKDYSAPGNSSTDTHKIIIPCEKSPLGFHHMRGIFMALGKNFKKGYQVEKSSIVDLAPTILYTMGIPVPRDMDGRVLQEIFHKSYLKDHPLYFSEVSSKSGDQEEKVYSNDEQQKIEKRLKGLGYLD